MGNTASSNKIQKFGTLNPQDGQRGRPGYYCNSSKFYYNGQPIDKLPCECKLTKLGYGYAKTDARVFFGGIVIPNANSQTFSVTNRKNKQNLNDIAILKKLDCVIGMDTINDKPRYYRNGILL